MRKRSLFLLLGGGGLLRLGLAAQVRRVRALVSLDVLELPRLVPPMFERHAGRLPSIGNGATPLEQKIALRRQFLKSNPFIRSQTTSRKSPRDRPTLNLLSIVRTDPFLTPFDTFRTDAASAAGSTHAASRPPAIAALGIVDAPMFTYIGKGSPFITGSHRQFSGCWCGRKWEPPRLCANVCQA